MKPFSGVISLVPTPLKKNSDVDKEDLEKIIDYQFENGCDGVGVLAGIGEGYLLTSKTKTDTIKTAVDCVNSKGPLIVGCPGMKKGLRKLKLKFVNLGMSFGTM